MISPPPDLSGTRRSIIFSCLSILFFWGAVYIYMPILSPYTKVVTGSLQSVGIVLGAYGLAQFVLRIPLGLWSDRWRRRKPFVLLGFVFDGLAALGLSLSGSAAALFFSVLTAGIASSMWVPFAVLFSSYFPPGRIAYSMSLVLFCTRVAQITTNYAGGLIAEAWGWLAPFYAGIFLSVIGFFIFLRAGERRPAESAAASFPQLLRVGGNRQLLLASILCALFLFVNFSTSYGFTPIFAQQIGASKADLGVLFFWYMLPNSIATLLSGTYLRRLFSEPAMIFAGFLLMAGTVLVIPLVQRLGSLYLLQGINGIGVGLIFPLLMGAAIETSAPGQQATAMGFFQSLYAVGMTLGPILSGVIAQRWGLTSVFISNGLLCLIAAFFVLGRAVSAGKEGHDRIQRKGGI